MEPEGLVAVMHSDKQGQHLILTDAELIWVKKGMLGGKVERDETSSLKSVKCAIP